MEKGSLQIHSENILPIIKKWLYSEKDIFARELVSNACDAIHKVKILQDKGEIKNDGQDFRIDVRIDKDKRTLTFSDNGIGMDAEEVKKYIAQIAFSGAEEFLQKYQSNNEQDQIIGHFGLGFYSAYMVADTVEINTLSYKEGAEPVKWVCDGTSEYELDQGTRQTRGTDIILHIGAEHDECLDPHHMRQTLVHYSSFVPYPLYLENDRINKKEPLWVKPPSECTKEDYLEFYRYLYPMDEDPLFWVHLNVDYPFHLKGILYFPKLQREFDLNKASIKLYSNRIFVSDNCKDLIPEYLMVLKGVIDSPDIPLNVSRSYLQMDRTVKQLANHISKKVSDSIMTLFKNDREAFVKSWNDISVIVKLGILEDEKFYEKVKEALLWENTDHQWTTLEEYLTRNKEKTEDKIFYTTDEKHASHFLEMYRQKNIEVLIANHPVDMYVIHYLERKMSPVVFQRIDAEVHDTLLDKTREKTVLDAEGKTEAVKLADFVRSNINHSDYEVEAKSLASETLPAIIMIEEQQRRMRDHFRRLDQKGEMPNFGKRTFVINTNSPLIESIYKLQTKNPTLAKELIEEVFELTLLSQREMDPVHLQQFIIRTNRVLEALTKEVLK